jgi:cytochrome c-type biogenesis protein CcmH
MMLGVFAGLSLFSLVFVLWPWMRRSYWEGQSLDAPVQDATQRVLFQEHMADLERSYALGEMDEAHYLALKTELQRSLLAETPAQAAVPVKKSGGVLSLVVVAAVVPTLAFGLYMHWGAKADWDIFQLLAQQRQIAPDNNAAYEAVTADLIAKAKQRVEERPKNAQLWYMLASHAVSQQDFVAAEGYYRRLLELEPRSPQILAELAQLLFIKAQNVVTPEVRESVQAALKIAPNIPTALSLAGIDEFQQGQFAKAIDYWERALPLLDPQTNGYKALVGGIDKARQSLASLGELAPEPVAAAGPFVDIAVSLAATVSSSPEDTVFVYARAWQGAKMPLAIQKFTVGDLPKTVRLDKTMAMSPGMDLTSVPNLELVARVSKSGSAIAASGDWQGSQGPVSLGDLKAPVALVIDKQVP